MRRRPRHTIARWIAPLGLWLASPSSAAAYCRTTTVEPRPGSDPAACPESGLPLFWPTRRLGYAINERGFPDLSPEQLREILERSFGAWLDVDCGEQPIDLFIEQADQTTAIEPDDHVQPPRPNLIVYLAREEWEDDPRAFAITKLRYNARTGHILGADMVFNGGKDPFIACDEDACEGGEGTDLPNVVTHEAGHFVGLAHSDDSDSTMWHDAKASETDKRSLEPDDREGICAIYGPGVEPAPPPSRRDPVTGIICAAGLPRGPAPAGRGLLWLWLGLGGLTWARRCR
ncbi:MAG TPA: matrixin family metalloprotease [Polyangiales bacterium]